AARRAAAPLRPRDGAERPRTRPRARRLAAAPPALPRGRRGARRGASVGVAARARPRGRVAGGPVPRRAPRAPSTGRRGCGRTPHHVLTRVLLVAHGYPPEASGGAEIYARAVARALARGGEDEVVVLARESRLELPEHSLREEEREGLRVFLLNHTYRE